MTTIAYGGTTIYGGFSKISLWFCFHLLKQIRKELEFIHKLRACEEPFTQPPNLGTSYTAKNKTSCVCVLI